MFPQTLSLPPHFPPGFAEGTGIPRRALCASGKPYVTDSNTGQPVCLCQLQAGPTLPLPAAHGTGPGAHHSPNTSPLGFHLSPFHAPRVSGHDPLSGSGLGKDPISTRSIPIGGPYTAAALAAYHPYLYAGYEPGGVRKAAVRETTGPLKSWLHEHRKNPYPTKAEKIMLAIITKMTLTQVSTWFANARRRLKKESRLYTGRENDNDDQDDDGHDKDDDDDNDEEGTPKRRRELCESDEDINVDGDISDISDNEDATSTSAIATTASAAAAAAAAAATTVLVPNASPGSTAKQSPLSSSSSSFSSSSSSSSSSLSPYPSTPPFHSHFLPRPGPMPVFPLGGLPVTVAAASAAAAAVSHGVLKGPDLAGSSVSGEGAPPTSCGAAKALTSNSLSSGSQSSKTSCSSSSNGSSGSSSSSSSSSCPAAVPARPRIWSISEIIHSDASSPATAASPAAVTSTSTANNGSEGAGQLLNKKAPGLKTASQVSAARDVSHVTAQGQSQGQRQDFLLHRLASPFRTFEPAEVRLASGRRTASAFLVPGTHPGWAGPSASLRLANPCHVINVANGSECGGERTSPDAAGNPPSEASTRDCGPQTEALDLQTKKDEKDNNTICT